MRYGSGENNSQGLMKEVADGDTEDTVKKKQVKKDEKPKKKKSRY